MNAKHVIALLLMVVPVSICRAETITLSLPETEAAADSQVDVSVNLSGAKRMVAWQYVITYDPELLQVAEVTVGDVLEGASVESNDETPGRIAVAGARFQPVAEDGEMLKISFDVIGAPDNQSSLSIESAEAWQENETEILVETTAGSLTIAAATGLTWWPFALGAALLFLAAVTGLLLRGRRRAGGHVHAPPHEHGHEIHEHAHEVHEHVSHVPIDDKIHLKCPHCGSGLVAPPSAAGHSAKCVRCGKPLMIPPMAAVRQ